jgi:DOPA 4,5-dioxygenase
VIDVQDIDAIRSYHAHVYFDGSTRDVAEALRDAIAARFTVELGRVHDRPIGPHSQPMYQLKFAHDVLGALVPWLVLNRSGLNILVHPCTEDEVADHRSRSIWLGAPVPFNEEFLDRYIASKRS